MTQSMRLDHLVVMANSLDEGVRWCENTLGITPEAGGEHPLMGTHNRLVGMASNAHRQAYLEIIAPNPKVGKALERTGKRWFDMDDSRLKKHISHSGPQLIHWVAAVPNALQAVAKLQALGIDRGEVLRASRPTPAGLLQWQITVREDGQRLFDGCLPTLIEWGQVHPSERLASCGISLEKLELSHPQAHLLNSALQALGYAGTSVQVAPPGLSASLHTPKGRVTLHSGLHAGLDS
jgi:hypothetical protein